MSRSGVSVDIRGTEDLRRLGIALAAAADGRQLRSELGRNIRVATKPAIGEVKGNLATGLPKRGGLAAYFSRASIGTRTSLRGRSVGVRIVVSKKGNDIEGLNRGLIRHPLFGNRGHWYAQEVPADLITAPLDASKPDVRRGVLDAMDAVADRISRST